MSDIDTGGGLAAQGSAASGRDLTGRDQTDNRLSVNFDGYRISDLDMYARMIEDHEAALYGDRRSSFPGVKALLENLDKRIESLEKEFHELRKEIRGRRLMISDEMSRYLLWLIAVLLILSLLPWDAIRNFLAAL